MEITKMFGKRPVMSLEIFPPKGNMSLKSVLAIIEAVIDLCPDFISVTYGAGGSSRELTVEIADIIKNRYGIETLAHLSCIGSTRGEIEALLAELRSKNIKNILALRGDPPQDFDRMIQVKADYEYAKDLITHIKSLEGFYLAAACYPEGHIDCISLEEDLQFLKEKVNCGVDFLITQMFFDNNLFYSFQEKLAALGIDCPVSAGIMPVVNKKQIERITELCGTTLPPELKRLLSVYENKPEALKEAGIIYASEQIVDLLASGVDGIHLYTMNSPKVAAKVYTNIKNIRGSFTHED